MSQGETISSLGEIMQLAFVPSDFDAAVKYWTEVMGVGPFYLIENIHLDGMKYKGSLLMRYLLWLWPIGVTCKLS